MDDDWRTRYPFYLAQLHEPFKATLDELLSPGDLEAIADSSPDPDSFIVRVGHAVAVRLKRRSESKA